LPDSATSGSREIIYFAIRMGPLLNHEVSGNVSVEARKAGQRYEAVLRLSEALSVCPEPEDLTKILSDRLREFLHFLQFYIIVYKENSDELDS
jgi:hypothetical protein